MISLAAESRVLSKFTLTESLYQIKSTHNIRFKFKPVEYNMEVLNPYPEGEWAAFPRREGYLEQVYGNDMEDTLIGKVEDDKLSREEDNEKSEVYKIKKDTILRGPFWNYGLRKISSDADYYNHILFGIPWASVQTPDDMILRGKTWIANKPIIRSLALFIMRKLKKMNPGKTALLELETGRSISYGDMINKIESLAYGLHCMGVQEEQIMAIVSYNSIEAHLMVLACLLIGAVVALVDSSLSAVELGIVLRITSPSLLFTEPGKTQLKVEAAVSYLEMSLHSRKPTLIINSTSLPTSTNYMLFNQIYKEVHPEDPTPGPRRADPLRPILILYNSDVENLRACLISERYFTHSMPFVDTVLPDSDEPSITVMLTPPMYWALTIKTVLNHYIDGHRIIICRGPIPEPCLITALRKFEVFALLTIRATLMSLLDWPAKPRIPHLKLVAVTGIPLQLKFLKRVSNDLFKNQAQLLQLYGLVETGTTAANTFLENKHGSVGKLFFNVEMKVLEEGTGVPLGPNQEGELCVRSPTMMLGYYNNPVANEEAIDAEGFFHTGDLGYYDEQGFVHVTDQVREMIKWRTYLVSPSMVEEVLTEFPCVKEALVFGIFDEDDGEIVTAAVILETGHENVDIATLEKQVNASLPTHRRIRGGIYIFDQFPRSTIGKPVKDYVLKEVLERRHKSHRKNSSA